MQLNVYPGLKGLKEMLGTVPAWIHYEERERVEVLRLHELSNPDSASFSVPDVRTSLV